MKNRVIISMIVAVLTIFSAISFAADEVRVQLDGQYLNFTDENGAVVNPQIINDRTMVPMRKIFETYGAKISWNDATRTVVATTDEKEITLTIDNPVSTVKDLATGEVETVTLDSAPVIVDSRTLVPIRYISESLDKTVGWDNDERVAIIIDLEKLATVYSQKVPAVQELMNLNLEAIESYKSVSNVEATLEYKDLEDDSQNETITATGTANINVTKSQDLEATTSLKLTGGNGDIMNAIVEGGLDNIDLKAVLLDGFLYVGVKGEDGEYLWTDQTSAVEGAVDGSGVDVASLGEGSLGKSINNINDYKDLIKFMQNFMGELNVNTYNTLVSAADFAASIFDTDTLEVVNEGNGKGTFKLNIDVMKMITRLAPDSSLNLPDANVVFNLLCNIENHRVQSESANVKFEYNSEESLEFLGFEVKLDTTYTNYNEDFDVEF